MHPPLLWRLHALAVQLGERAASLVGQPARQDGADGVGERDVDHDPAAKERRRPVLRPVDELVRDHDVARPDLFAHRAAGGDGHDASHAEQLERVQVGPERDLRRREAMTATVARKKRDPGFAETADHDRVRWLAERRGRADLDDVAEALDLVEPGAADYAEVGRGRLWESVPDTFPIGTGTRGLETSVHAADGRALGMDGGTG